MHYPKFLYKGARWSGDAKDHRMVKDEEEERAAAKLKFLPIDHSLTVKPPLRASDLDIDGQVRQFGSPLPVSEEPALPERKPGVARGRPR